MSIGGRTPYEPRDQWAVLPDGRLGVARVAPYRAEWVGGGAPVSGPAVAYQPVRIGSAEKNAWADQVAARGIQVVADDRGRRTQRAPRPDIDRQQWPEAMPPFSGPGAVLASPAGELWVLKTRPADAPGRTYDVFDARGRLTRRVTLEGERTILGFGPGVVFVSYENEDDLLWIERYRMPT